LSGKVTSNIAHTCVLWIDKHSALLHQFTTATDFVDTFLEITRQMDAKQILSGCVEIMFGLYHCWKKIEVPSMVYWAVLAEFC